MTKYGTILAGLVGLMVALFMTAHTTIAQTLTTLSSFNNSTNGSGPEGRLTLSADGNTLYGTTFNGGARSHGEVFSLPVSGGTPTVLASFTGGNGGGPPAGVTLSGNTLYGTTYGGGASALGVIFSLPVSGGTPTVLASFTGGSNGSSPEGGLTLSGDGNTLYGTTAFGGAYNDGVVFSIPVSGGTPTVLASFNGINGEQPEGDLTLSNDGRTLYGTTEGRNGYGTVFSIPVSGGNPTVLASFSSTNGKNPVAGLTLSGNVLYGTTDSGGAYNDGVVFSIPVSGGTPTVLASFNGANGNDPVAGLTLSGDGNTLYGTTEYGGAGGQGEVFSLPVSGGTPMVLVSFTGSNGWCPKGGLTLSADGNTLYGTTWAGISNGGTVFALNLTPAPEPSTFALLGVGAISLAAYAWRRKQAA